MAALYRGWRGTKLGLALIAMGLTTVAYAFTGWAHELFGDYCMALVALAAGQHAASVLEKATAKPDKPDAPAT